MKRLDIMGYEKFESIEAVGNVYEITKHMMQPMWYGAIDILVSQLLLNKVGRKRGVPVEAVISALQFSQTYYHLRDYLYFAYNVPNSVAWHFDEENKIRIDLLDDSFQLQEFLNLNNYFLKSIEVFSGFKAEIEKTKKYVEQTQEEFVESSSINLAYKRCLREAELKLSHYHSFLTDDIEFNGYSVGQFKSVYKHVLARALLRRYFVSKYHARGMDNHNSYILTLDRKQFLEALVDASGCSSTVVEKIVSDLTLDEFKIGKNQGITSFPLIYCPDDDFYYLFPNCTCFCDVFISLRKAWALKNPGHYGKVVAPIVGDELAKYIERLLKANGFAYVKRNVRLKRGIPDIDVLAVWPESGFGYVIFLCETKNPIPEKFGKDFVRSIGSKGFLTKAAKQIKDIGNALGPYKLHRLLTTSFPGVMFEYGKYGLNFLIITSQNIGVFFEEGVIIDYETLGRILKSSKGDILRILNGLKKDQLIQACKRCSRIRLNKSKIDKYEVQVPQIEIISLLN